jgi:hypothetical protein
MEMERASEDARCPELKWEDEGAPVFLNESIEEVSRFSEPRNTSTSNITTIKTMIDLGTSIRFSAALTHRSRLDTTR